MINVPYYDGEGNEGEPLEIDETVFGKVVKRLLMREAVLMYQACRRVGTACTKTRAQVSGSGKKPFRQKGTGRARRGTMRSAPLYRKGGVAWGPKPRDYSYSIPKKARKGALKSAILSKLKDNQTKIIEKLEAEEPKTGRFVKLLDKMGISGSCLVGLAEQNENIHKSIRNIKNVRIDETRNFNALEVLRSQTLLLTKDALAALQEAAGK
jgi:large subunit ribosomal protein L4